MALLKELFLTPIHGEAFIADTIAETKSNEPETTPAPLPDPHGVAFTQAELDALTDVDSPEAVRLAFGLATDEKRAMLNADVINGEA